jgi:hypothetical protein
MNRDAPARGGRELSKLATVLEVEPAELLRVPVPKGEREGCR